MGQEGEDHSICKEIRTEPEAPLLAACPGLWEAPPLATLQAIFAILAQGWGTNSGEMAKPVGRAVDGCLKRKGPPIQGEKESRRKGWRAWRRQCERWGSCYHQEQCQAALGKSSGHAQVCPHPSPFLPRKNREKEKVNISYKENITCQRRKLLCGVSIVFISSHFLTVLLGQQLVSVCICSTKPLFSEYIGGLLLFREVRSE